MTALEMQNARARSDIFAVLGGLANEVTIEVNKGTELAIDGFLGFLDYRVNGRKWDSKIHRRRAVRRNKELLKKANA